MKKNMVMLFMLFVVLLSIFSFNVLAKTGTIPIELTIKNNSTVIILSVNNTNYSYSGLSDNKYSLNYNYEYDNYKNSSSVNMSDFLNKVNDRNVKDFEGMQQWLQSWVKNTYLPSVNESELIEKAKISCDNNLTICTSSLNNVQSNYVTCKEEKNECNKTLNNNYTYSFIFIIMLVLLIGYYLFRDYWSKNSFIQNFTSKGKDRSKKSKKSKGAR